MTLCEDMYDSVQHVLEKRADMQRNKIYCDSCLFLYDNDEIS